jgi:hypothetical protein
MLYKATAESMTGGRCQGQMGQLLAMPEESSYENSGTEWSSAYKH